MFYLPEYVPHRVQTRLHPGYKARGPQRPISEGTPGEGAVDDFYLLALGVEDEPVFPDDRSATQGVNPDLTLLPRLISFPTINRHVLQALAPSFSGGPP